MVKLPSFCSVFLFFYFAESKTYTGTIYAHNWFKLWVNGREVAVDPVVTSPQNAVKFTFEDDAPCRTYAIFASDGVDTESGLIDDDTCIDNGGIRILIEDSQGLKEVVSDIEWRFHHYHYGPTNWEECGKTDGNCRTTKSTSCGIQIYAISQTWCLPSEDNNVWDPVKEYADGHVGYGTKPNVTGFDGCVDPQTVDWKGAKFIWGTSLKLDNDVLLWYRKCDGGATPPTEDDDRTCSMNKPPVRSEIDACRENSAGNLEVSAMLTVTLVSLSLLY